MNEFFNFSAKEKKFSLGLLIVGAVLFALGALLNLGNPSRIWTALLYNNFFALGISLAAVFFVAANNIGYGGWITLVKRVFEGVGSFVMIGGILLLGVVALGMHDIYHWTHADLMNPQSAHYDELLAEKAGFLNIPFFWMRIITYVVGWAFFTWLLRQNSISIDKSIDTSLAQYKKSKVISAIFMIFFAVTSSTSSWDFTMSIQPHWYSTLYGWYTFMSYLVSGMTVVMMFTLYLKSKGYLKLVSFEHIHDLGKFMFAFSVAWGYLFFSQFMLYWYSNIPEETSYFLYRAEHLPHIMFLCVVLNFVFPFFILITRGNKRNYNVIMAAGTLILIGHWLDFYQMTMPGVMQNMHVVDAAGNRIFHAGIGPLEIGAGLFFAGLLSYMAFNTLSKTSLVSQYHPFIKESIIHHT